MAAPSTLTKLLALRHPVLLAPMAGVSGGLLAAAVSRAGGLGFLGAGYGDSPWLQHELSLCDDAPVGVGFITWAPCPLLRQAASPTQRWDPDIPGLRDAIVQEMGHYHATQLTGDFDTAATIAGEAADMVRSIDPAANIVQAMVDQCQALL